jgi:hypothetical protein
VCLPEILALNYRSCIDGLDAPTPANALSAIAHLLCRKLTIVVRVEAPHHSVDLRPVEMEPELSEAAL